MSIWNSLHLHEITVVLLSEIIFNRIKFKSMKDMICKINIHLSISYALKTLGCLIFWVGGQTIPLDRLCSA
jgi:hypothetical protein